MKSMEKLAGLIAIVAVIGFGMTACDQNKGDEDFEATTSGRLTITGLSDYVGQDIYALNISIFINSDNSETYLWAGERATNTYSNEQDLSMHHAGNTRSPAKVASGGQVVLKVFVDRGTRSGKGGGLGNYGGSEQNVKFDVYFGANNYRGTVTVNFSNGIGTGAFVPTP